MKIKNTIHGLWIKGSLSPVELLTIESFIRQKYEFILWSYDLDYANLPKGVVLKNAREIIPEQEVFRYTQTNQFGHGKGSYAGFSDIFRYKLLFEHGGWWTDMDITCLKRLPEPDDFFFRANEDTTKAVGNLIFCLPQSPLMDWCYQQARVKINASNTDWALPIQILNDGIKKFQLEQNIQSISNRDSWLEVSHLIKNRKIPSSYFCVHWMNEELGRLKINKNSFPSKTNIYQLVQSHSIEVQATNSLLGRIDFYIKTSIIYYIFINIGHLRSYLRK